MTKKTFLEKDPDDPNRWVARDGSGEYLGNIHRVDRRGWLVSHAAEAGQEQPAPDVAFETFDAAQEALTKTVA